MQSLELTRVLVACPNAAAFAAAAEAPSAVAGELQRAGEAAAGLLLQHGGHTLRVRETAPFTRGKVTPDTVVLLLRPDALPPSPAVPPAAAEAAAAADAGDPLLRFSPFCRPRPAAAVPVRCCFAPFCGALAAGCSEATEDEADELWVARAPAAVAAGLRLWDGSRLVVTAGSDPAPGAPPAGSYQIQIRIDTALEGEDLLVAPAAFCALYRHSPGLNGLRSADSSGACGAVRVLRSDAPEPPPAESVDVRPVRTPALADVPQELVEGALRDYFARSRTLHVGDVFAAPLRCPPAERPDSAVEMLLEGAEDPAADPFPDVVHFVVDRAAAGGGAPFLSPQDALLQRSAAPHSFVVRQGQTRLAYQTGPVAAAIPCRAPQSRSALRGTAPLRELTEFIADVLAVPGYSAAAVVVGTEENSVGEALRLAAAGAGCHLLSVSCQTAAKELDELARLVRIAADAAPCVLALRHAEAHFPPRQAQQGQPSEAPPDDLTPCLLEALAGTSGVVVACCTASDEGLPSSFLSSFHKVVQVDNPSQGDRKLVAEGLLQQLSVSCAVTADSLSRQTAGMPFAALPQIAAGAAKECARRVCGEEADLWQRPLAVPPAVRLVLSPADFTAAVDRYAKAHQVNVTTNVQKVGWKDIGGLRQPKEEILQCIHLPLSQPELFAQSGLKARTGILMFGPPGCGKTLLAKGVATECGLNFMSVKGPELINMYVGESERNIRELFHKARQAAPCIVFFDELDALAPNRGAKGDSGGVMDRIVSQLLTEVDGLGGDPSQFVFVVGATNRPDLLDPALLRPGRFDRCVYLGVSSTAKEQANILRAQTRKMNLDPGVDFAALVEDMPRTYSGADLYSLSTEAMMLAMRERIDGLVAQVEERRQRDAERAKGSSAAEEGEDDDGGGGGEMAAILIRQEHFEAARASVKPSVTPADLKRYEEMRAKFM